MINVLVYGTDTDAVDQLRVGRADAAMDDDPVAAYYVALNPNFEVALAAYNPQDEGIAISKTNADMKTAITSGHNCHEERRHHRRHQGQVATEVTAEPIS